MLSCTSILLTLSLVQFVVIVNLIYSVYNLQHAKVTPSIATTNPSTSESSLVSTEVTKALVKVEAKAEEEEEVEQNTTPTTKKYRGVAVTMMLHTPTWFQRRYTMMVQNTYDNLPEDWAIQIFYTGEGQSLKGVDINRGLRRLVDKGKVILTVIPKSVLSRKKKKFELMTEKWIWENMLADTVLLFGGGSVICSNSIYTIEDFTQYDYIGGPWNAFKGVGGDGGLSIRKRKLMLQAINYELDKAKDDEARLTSYKTWGQEDVFFISRILEMQKKGLVSNLRIATKNESMRFQAIGNTYNNDVFSVSGTIPGVSFIERDKFLTLCPEIKMFYPSLHDPNCFGASPDSEGCAKSICALKPKTERKGGC